MNRIAFAVRTKTRLIPRLTHAGACRLARQCLARGIPVTLFGY